MFFPPLRDVAGFRVASGAAEFFRGVGDEGGDLLVVEDGLERQHGLDVFVVLFEDALQDDGGEELGMIALDERRLVERRGHLEIAGTDPFSIGTVAGDAGLVGEAAELEDLVVLRGEGKTRHEGRKEGEEKDSLHLISGPGRLV